MKKIFETRVTGIGAKASEFITDNNMMILFGEGAPKDLVEYCYIIPMEKITGNIVPGGTFIVDNQTFAITAVGDVVKQNLETLGHITIAFDGEVSANLPGTLHVEKLATPLQIGNHAVLQLFEI